MLIGYDKYCGIVIVLLILADTTITWICKAVRHKSLNGQSSVPTHCCRPAKIDYQIKTNIMYFFLVKQSKNTNLADQDVGERLLELIHLAIGSMMNSRRSE